MRWKDCPEKGSMGSTPPDDKVMHASVRIGDSTILASDGNCSRADSKPQGFALSLTAKDPAEAQTPVRRVGRRRPGADAAGQDVLLAGIRYACRQVRRIMDGLRRTLRDRGARRVHREPATSSELPGPDGAGQHGARRAGPGVRGRAEATFVYTRRPGSGATARGDLRQRRSHRRSRDGSAIRSATTTRYSCSRRCREDSRMPTDRLSIRGAVA